MHAGLSTSPIKAELIPLPRHVLAPICCSFVLAQCCPIGSGSSLLQNGKTRMNSPASLQVPAPGAAAPATYPGLSVRLRDETRLEHKAVEAACGLPGLIHDLTGYKNCLLDFYGIFCPIERQIATFDEWSHRELSMHSRSPDASAAAGSQATRCRSRLVARSAGRCLARSAAVRLCTRRAVCP